MIDTTRLPARVDTATVTIKVFSKLVTGGINGRLTVPAGQAVYLAPGSTVNGSVTVQPGGTLAAEGANVHGWIQASGAVSVRLCGSTVSGSLTVANTTGLVVVGDDDGAVACAGNKLKGLVSITGNSGGVRFDGNTVSGSLTITGNTGTLAPPDSGSVDATGTTSAARWGSSRSRTRRGTVKRQGRFARPVDSYLRRDDGAVRPGPKPALDPASGLSVA